MSDLISRQAAIDALAKFVPYVIDDISTESYTNGLTDAYNLIRQLPSVQPDQEKPAKWIIYEVANCDGEPPIAWECPECGEVVSCKYKFCPECGKPMEV